MTILHQQILPLAALDALYNAFQAIAPELLPQAVSWHEAFEDFTDWLQQSGQKADGLPRWPGGAAVHVVAVRPRRKGDMPHYFLRRMGGKEIKRRNKMLAAGNGAIEGVPVAELARPPWHKVTIVEIDPARFQRERGRRL